MATDIAFKVALFMKPFLPSDISLQVVNGVLIIEADHGSERIDQHGFSERELIRKYHLPDDVDLDSLQSLYTKSGILIIWAQKQKTEDVLKSPKYAEKSTFVPLHTEAKN